MGAWGDANGIGRLKSSSSIITAGGVASQSGSMGGMNHGGGSIPGGVGAGSPGGSTLEGVGSGMDKMSLGMGMEGGVHPLKHE